ncbi:glycosyltransferase family A protein [Maridesulfovibrio ferrireducens]|uniref:glycosyltransferase family 2 protein n=1 Tax=Maridesulfovibrio ferrireducens TaxID=246191 RepID=UPI001A21FC64|nr:glycosyltransferase family A protein [Maridesulfovibrio ferrireducens]MBI9111897.1 glycosyltransferase family 2 protein [Maridesulfovibrio ferrireducens]
MTLLSIIIPNYNYGRFADRFFSSLIAQSMSFDDVEILFVDDGSSDDSIEQAQKWADKIECEKFEILTPVRTGKPGFVRNFGLERAKGKYLICLDPDDILHPDFIPSCIEILDHNPEIDLVYTDYLENRLDGSREVRLPKFNQAHLRTQNTISPAAMYRRKFWDSGIRYKDNSLYEDWDYWVQCLMAGAKFRLIPHVLYNYEIHETNYSIQAVKDDGVAKAQIVLNNPDFFHPMVQHWASDHMRGRIHASAFQRGYIPRPEDIKALLIKIETGMK